jgi:Leu/Phe-tRNA-protein transferase
MLFYSGSGVPFVVPPEDCDAVADWMEAFYPEEFCASESFDPDFVEALSASGFIAMATSEDGCEFLVPKLHTLRSVMEPRDFRLTRTARRESSRYKFDVDRRFDEVLAACVATHGEGWLRPPLMECWRELFASRSGRRARFASMEVYRRGDLVARHQIVNDLVAGEIGVFAGACYTSLTGFRRESGSGTVQLAATARYLEASGVRLWDLGMPLDYKASLGARNVSRREFLALFRAARASSLERPEGSFDARSLVDGLAARLRSP